MITFLRGILIDILSDSVILDVGGIGYEVQVHQRAIQGLTGRTGREVLLFTRLLVSDSDFRLYGFINREELELFKTLINMSGLGPRIAMAILGAFEPRKFYELVAAQDVKMLTTVPGVGRKSAERIMFEFKDRVPKGFTGVSGGPPNRVEELLEAMEALGYTRSEVYTEVMEVAEREEASLEEQIKILLRMQGARRVSASRL